MTYTLIHTVTLQHYTKIIEITFVMHYQEIAGTCRWSEYVGIFVMHWNVFLYLSCNNVYDTQSSPDVVSAGMSE